MKHFGRCAMLTLPFRKESASASSDQTSRAAHLAKNHRWQSSGVFGSGTSSRSSIVAAQHGAGVERTGDQENIRFNLLLQGIPENRIPACIEEIVEFTVTRSFYFSSSENL